MPLAVTLCRPVSRRGGGSQGQTRVNDVGTIPGRDRRQLVGQSRKRIGGDGKARYTAYYDDVTGRRRSAGTFASRREADRAWSAPKPRPPRAGTPTPAAAGNCSPATSRTSGSPTIRSN